MTIYSLILLVILKEWVLKTSHLLWSIIPITMQTYKNQLVFWSQEVLQYKWSTIIAAKSLQSCPTLCSPIDGSPPGSPTPGILQARTLEWVAIFFSRGIFLPWGSNLSLLLGGRFFTSASPGKPYHSFIHLGSPTVIHCRRVKSLTFPPALKWYFSGGVEEHKMDRETKLNPPLHTQNTQGKL